MKTDEQENNHSLSVCVCVRAVVAPVFMFIAMSTVNNSREISLSFLYDRLNFVFVPCVSDQGSNKSLHFFTQ